MPQLATICYIDNGKEFLMLHRNKSPMMSMKVNGSGWWKIRTWGNPQECAAREILKRQALEPSQS